MTITLIQICPLSGKRETILEILRHVEASVRGQPGCLECAIFEQADDGNAILYLERWLSAADLERHIRSDLFLRVLLAMELASRRPEVRFIEMAGTKDLHWVEHLRASDDAAL